MRRKRRKIGTAGTVLLALTVFSALVLTGVLVRSLYRIASGENSVALSESAEKLVRETILLNFPEEQRNAPILEEDHVFLGSEVEGTKTTVYLWVYRAGYTEDNGTLTELFASHVPMVLTFRESYGEYQSEELRIPRDGVLFEQDVKELFPFLLQKKALDPSPFISEQREKCRAKAEIALKTLRETELTTPQAPEAQELPPQVAPLAKTPEPDRTPRFPVKEANRAALTAMTNYYAADVKNTDGSYDPSRFHTYSDTSGAIEKYLIYDWQTGIWSGRDENTWHVDFLELNGADGRKRVVSMDVCFDGTEYQIRNAEDLTDDSGGEIDTELPPFRVSQYLIAEDRVFE